MAHLLPNVRQQFLDDNGAPVANGKLYSYVAGTSTPLATYSSQSELAANANPLILDSNGIGDVWLGSGTYKLVLKTSADVTVWTRDNVAHLSPGCVTTSKLADGVLSADADGLAKMAAGFLANSTSGRAKMADGFLSADSAGRAKMADGFVTPAKMEALGEQFSSSISFTTSSATAVDVTGASVTITTTGRPVFLGLVSGSTVGVNGYISATVAACALAFSEGPTVLSHAIFGPAVLPASSLWAVVTGLAAGAHTIKLQGLAGSGATLEVAGARLLAYEL